MSRMNPISPRSARGGSPARINSTPRPPAAAPRAAAQPARAAQPQTPLWQRGVSFFEQNRERLGSNARSGVSAFNSLRQARDLRRGFSAVDTSNSRMANLNRTRRLATPVYTVANNAVRLPGQIATAGRDLRQALRTGNTADWQRAIASTRESVASARTIAQQAPQARVGLQVGFNAARRLAPGLVDRFMGSAARLAESSAGRMATRLATRAAESSAGRIAARGLGRLVPAANTGIALLDSAEAVRAWRDPNASTGRRITSTLTAAGSWVAATNIPVVSQLGAAFSTLSSIVGSWFS